MDPADENITMVVDGAGNARLQTQDETITEPVTVVLSDDQWVWMQGAVRHLCSDCMVLIMLLGISCGLAAWRVLSDGWR